MLIKKSVLRSLDIYRLSKMSTAAILQTDSLLVIPGTIRTQHWMLQIKFIFLSKTCNSFSYIFEVSSYLLEIWDNNSSDSRSGKTIAWFSVVTGKRRYCTLRCVLYPVIEANDAHLKYFV